MTGQFDPKEEKARHNLRLTALRSLAEVILFLSFFFFWFHSVYPQRLFPELVRGGALPVTVHRMRYVDTCLPHTITPPLDRPFEARLLRNEH